MSDDVVRSIIAEVERAMNPAARLLQRSETELERMDPARTSFESMQATILRQTTLAVHCATLARDCIERLRALQDDALGEPGSSAPPEELMRWLGLQIGAIQRAWDGPTTDGGMSRGR